MDVPFLDRSDFASLSIWTDSYDEDGYPIHVRATIHRGGGDMSWECNHKTLTDALEWLKLSYSAVNVIVPEKEETNEP